MEMERLRQTHAKEVESRDEEVEEIRQSCQKKVGLCCGPSAQEGLGCIPMPWLGTGSCQPGTVTQHRLPHSRPQPGSTGPAGPTSPSAARASARRALCLWLRKHPAGGVTQCPRGVGTREEGGHDPSLLP